MKGLLPADKPAPVGSRTDVATTEPTLPTETAPPAGALASLAVPNFRRFVIGQTISLIGSWTETVAQALLVLHLTNSGTALGLGVAARYLPALLLTPYGGLIVDRYDKRRLLLITQTLLGLLSALLAVLTAEGLIRYWSVIVIALCFGALTAIDNPARQAFIPEMVGPSLIRNAIVLNSTMVNVGRSLGPIVASLLIARTGIAWCFAVNAASFIAVIISLLAMDRARLYPAPVQQRHRGQLIAGFRYALSVPHIRTPIAMMVLIGTFTYEFEVSLPLLGQGPLADHGTTYSWLLGAFGLGSVIGGAWGATVQRPSMRRLIGAAVAYGIGMSLLSASSSLWIAVPVLIFVGMSSITFITTGNSMLQIASRPEYHGRVTALWSTAFVGSTPIGSTIIGYAGSISPRLSIVIGAVACFAAVVVGLRLATGNPPPAPGSPGQVIPTGEPVPQA